jgi:diacylglycerol kinase family enzyme
MRMALVHNPSATSVTPRARVVIGKALAADHDLTVHETSRQGHATRLAQGAAADGVDVVVVLGGDGTVNEAANGLAGSHTALGVLPGGSTNVFARTIGMTNDPIEATGELLGALGRGSIRRVGLGTANGRFFCFHTGIGFDAAVVQMVETRSALKRYAGHTWFAWAGARQWGGMYDRRHPRLSVRHADGSIVDDGVFSLVQNTNPYTYLGNRPFDTAPDAGFDRGLHVITFRRLDLVTILSALGTALRGGGVRSRRGIVVRADQAEVVVTGHGPFPWQMDGEYLGEIEHLVLEKVPDVLDLVIP